MARLVVTVSGTGGPPLAAPVVSFIDANGNLVYNGSPVVVRQLNGMSYDAWKTAGYTEAQADAMIAEAVAAGANVVGGRISSPSWGTYFANPAYNTMEGSAILQAKFPGVFVSFGTVGLGWSPPLPYPPIDQIEISNIITLKNRSRLLYWSWSSEPVSQYYATLLPHYQLHKQLDPAHGVTATELITDGRNLNYGNFYTTGAIGDGGYWDEICNASGLNLPIVELVESRRGIAGASVPWDYCFFMNRRLRGLSVTAPSSPIAASAGAAGVLNGSYLFVYTISYGTGYRDPDAVESCPSPLSVAVNLSNQQASLTGFAGAPTNATYNLYGFKVGVSPTGGMWLASNFHMIAAALPRTTTSYTVTTDWPWNLGQGAPSAPPPARTTLGWMPSISTTPVEELFGYVNIQRIANLPTFDQTSRWWWFQIAMNCRASEVLWPGWERCPTGNNDPVVLALTQNTKIAFVSSNTADTRTCSIEGILTDGTTIVREDNIVLNGTTPVQSANTYSLVKWVAVQSAAVPFTIVGNLSSGSAVVTGIANTSALAIKMEVFGTNIPSNAQILSVDSGTQITLTASATGSASAETMTVGHTITVTQVTGGQNILGLDLVHTDPTRAAAPVIGNNTFDGPTGNPAAYFKTANDGLPDGYLQLWHDTWTVNARIKTIDNVLTAPGIWQRIGAVTPPFVVYNAAGSDPFQGIYAAKKSAGGFLYVIAINLDQQTQTGPDNALSGATIDVGQTINTVVRIAGESGSPSFAGSVITDNFAAAQVHVYRVT